jgi:hypothetical protein
MRTAPLLIVLLGVLAAGCSGGDNQATTPELKKAFLGGPMPKDFQAKQQEMMSKAMAKAQQSAQQASQK